LLNVDIHLGRNLLEDIARLTSPMNVGPGHDQAQQSRGKHNPSAEAWNLERHRVQCN